MNLEEALEGVEEVAVEEDGAVEEVVVVEDGEVEEVEVVIVIVEETIQTMPGWGTGTGAEDKDLKVRLLDPRGNLEEILQDQEIIMKDPEIIMTG